MIIPVSLGYNVRNTIERQPLTFSNGNILYVGGDGPNNYTIIQDAIDNASHGDTVFVYNGTYYENVVIRTSISLIGEDNKITIIDAQLKGDVIGIVSDNVYLSGFTIKNSGNNGHPIDWDAGIDINSEKNIIKNNIITNNFNAAIYSYFTSNNIISSNLIFENEGCGIYFLFNGKNTIANNIIQDNNDTGIYIGPNDYSNSIFQNIIKNNEYGIILSSSQNNTIKRNNIENNIREGICLNDAEYNKILCNIIQDNKKGLVLFNGASNNSFYRNNFINNTMNANDCCCNVWDNGYTSGGNYWHDYNGIDNNGDGIGDTPYYIPGGDNKDRYPLMEPWKNVPPNSPIINGQTNGKVGIDYNYTFVAIDPDGDDIWYYVNWGDKEIIYIYGPYPSGETITLSYNWSNKGNYIIQCKAVDEYKLESNWSESEVIIPKTRGWLRFLDMFPILQRILNIII